MDAATGGAESERVMSRLGWECSRCHRSLAPHVDECPCSAAVGAAPIWVVPPQEFPLPPTVAPSTIEPYKVTITGTTSGTGAVSVPSVFEPFGIVGHLQGAESDLAAETITTLTPEQIEEAIGKWASDVQHGGLRVRPCCKGRS